MLLRGADRRIAAIAIESASKHAAKEGQIRTARRLHFVAGNPNFLIADLQFQVVYQPLHNQPGQHGIVEKFNNANIG